jgi:hypothetical protein
VSLITLMLTLAFRWWDNRTHLDISCHVFRLGERVPQSLINEMASLGPVPQEPEVPTILFRMYNRGRPPVRLREIRLASEGGQVIALSRNDALSGVQADQISTFIIPSGTAASFMQDIQLLARDIRAVDEGDTVRCELVVEDTTMRAHKKLILMRDVLR